MSTPNYQGMLAKRGVMLMRCMSIGLPMLKTQALNGKVTKGFTSSSCRSSNPRLGLQRRFPRDNAQPHAQPQLRSSREGTREKAKSSGKLEAWRRLGTARSHVARALISQSTSVGGVFGSHLLVSTHDDSPTIASVVHTSTLLYSAS